MIESLGECFIVIGMTTTARKEKTRESFMDHEPPTFQSLLRLKNKTELGGRQEIGDSELHVLHSVFGWEMMVVMFNIMQGMRYIRQ